MIDLCDKGSMIEEMNNKRTCADCGTTKTPLWRGGPAGPKSLCNACGIRSRKRRRAVLGVSKAEEKKSKKGQNSNITSSSNSSSSSSSNNHNDDDSSNKGTLLIGKKNSSKLGYPLKERLMALGREVLRMRSSVGRPRKMLCEEEQAAVLLMALSYGSVYA